MNQTGQRSHVRFLSLSLAALLLFSLCVNMAWGPAQRLSSAAILGVRWKGMRPLPAIVPTKELFLWSTPRDGGFNNQLITVYEALRCAQVLNRTVVLPMLYSNVRYDTRARGPFPFSDYFDVAALAQEVRVATPDQFFLGGLPCLTVLHAEVPRLVPRLLKDVYGRRLGIRLERAKTVDNAPPCVDDSFCAKLVNLKAPAELGAYSDYAREGQGYSIRRSPVLRRLRAALQPAAGVRGVADAVRAHIGGPYNAMHVRRGDYDRKCRQMKPECKRFGPEAFFQSRRWLRARARAFADPVLPLFVSTTHPREVRAMLRGAVRRVVVMDDAPLPWRLRWAARRVDVVSYASQIVAAGAAQFVGNRFSSYTANINYMRILRAPNETSLFF